MLDPDSIRSIVVDGKLVIDKDELLGEEETFIMKKDIQREMQREGPLVSIDWERAVDVNPMLGNLSPTSVLYLQNNEYYFIFSEYLHYALLIDKSDNSYYRANVEKLDAGEYAVKFNRGDHIYIYVVQSKTLTGYDEQTPTRIYQLIRNNEVVKRGPLTDSEKNLLMRLDIIPHPSNEFLIGGINTNEAIENLTEINGISIEELEERLRSSFLDPGTRLKDVLIEDNTYVLEKGYTHQQLAQWLFDIMSLFYIWRRPMVYKKRS